MEHTGLGPDGGETATYKVGESNGVVNFGQYLPDNEIGNSESYLGGDFEVVPALWETQQTQVILQADDFNSANGVFVHNSSSNSSAGITQQLETPFVPENWYCVDVIVKNELTSELIAEGYAQNFSVLYVAGVLGDSPEIIAANGSFHGGLDLNYPINSFGQVVGGSDTKSMKLYPIDTEDVGYAIDYNPVEETLYRCVFQYKALQDGTLYEQGEHLMVRIWSSEAPPTAIIKDVKMFDISEGIAHEYPNGWESVNYNVEGVHALSNFVDIYSPYDLYRRHTFLKNGKINWNLSSYSNTDSNWGKRIKQLNYDLPSTQAQNGTEEYTFSFNVSPNAFGNFSGSLTAFVCNGDDQGVIINNIDTPGNYLFKLDFKESDYSISTVIGSPSEASITTNGFHERAIELGANPGSGYTNYRNQIQFIPVPGDDSPDDSNFDGAIDNVSLIGTYLINQGGEVESWVIEGVEEGTNEIVFNDGTIAFNNAVGVASISDVETYIYQTLPIDLGNNKFRIKFDYTCDQAAGGAIGYMVLNGSGQGTFSASGGYVSASFGTVDTVIEIDSTAPSQGFFPNQSIVFFPLNEGTSATIDNIIVQQIYSGDFEDLTTVSFSEDVKGWVSFKSFLPESGLSLNNKYYTFKTGGIWAHDTNDVRNNFYGDQYKSSFTAIINDYPSTIKDFRTLNYEGSQSKVIEAKSIDVGGPDSLTDLELYNATGKEGWTVKSIITDLEEGSVNEFLKKEGKWFNYIKGKSSNTSEDLLGKLNFQGLGVISEGGTATVMFGDEPTEFEPANTLGVSVAAVTTTTTTTTTTEEGDY